MKKKLASKEEYCRIEKLYRLEVRKNNIKHENKIAGSSNKNYLYKYMNRKLKNRNEIPPLKSEEGKVFVEPLDKANLLNSTFQKVFIKDDGKLPDILHSNEDMLPMGWTVISPSEVKHALNNMKSSVSRTPDGVPALF